MQLAGPGVVPFGPNKQTLLLDALYNQLADTCQIATARPGEVRGSFPVSLSVLAQVPCLPLSTIKQSCP